MAIALRRVLLRSNSSQCSLRSSPISGQLRSRRICPTNSRCFHQSASRWKPDEDEAPTSKKSPSISRKRSTRSKKSSMSTSPNPSAQTKEVDEDAVEQALVDSVLETGDLDTALGQFGIDASKMPQQEREELMQLVEQVREASMKEEKLDKLAEAMIEDAEDPDAIEDAVRRLDIDPNDLMSRSREEEREFLAETGVDPRDDKAIEAASLKAFAGVDASKELDLNGQATQIGGKYQKLPFNIEDYEDDVEALPEPEAREAPGYWNEDKHEDLGPDENFNQDDLPAAGHMELDLHREIREYARLIVWELPLLSKLARPFSPPEKDQVLRFRYTTYMGEDHPAESKVVVSFSPSHPSLKLTPTERAKLIKLAGVRYNPSKDTIKLACETFDTPAQNKRYVGDQVEVLLKEARDPTDDLADVPFDFRHHRPKPVYTFPDAWKLTPERKAALLEARNAERAKMKQQLPDPAVDGLMFTPDGARMRERHRLKLGVIEREKAMLADPDLQKDQRTLLEDRTQERETLEHMMLVVDSRARRPSKRGVLSPELLKKGDDINKGVRA